MNAPPVPSPAPESDPFAYDSEEVMEAFYDFLTGLYGNDCVPEEVACITLRLAFTAGMNAGYGMYPYMQDEADGAQAE